MLALGPNDELQVAGSLKRPDNFVAYVLYLYASGYRVHDAELLADVDPDGRLVRLVSSVVPNLQPTTGTFITEAAARALAEQAVLSSGDPSWSGGPSFADFETPSVRVAWTHPWTQLDEARFVWRFVFDRADGPIAGRREILVDALNASVLAHEDLSRLMLDGRDTVQEVSGAIGAPLAPGILRWSGSDVINPCLTTSDAPPELDSLEQDLDEVKAGLCEAANVLERTALSCPADGAAGLILKVMAFMWGSGQRQVSA